MNDKIIKDLVELEIYSSKTLSKENFDNLSKNNTDSSLIYKVDCYEYGNENCNKYYKEINTHGLTEEDVKLQLEIDRTKNIRSIKNIATFFVVLTIISIVIMFFGGISLMDALR